MYVKCVVYKKLSTVYPLYKSSEGISTMLVLSASHLWAMVVFFKKIIMQTQQNISFRRVVSALGLAGVAVLFVAVLYFKAPSIQYAQASVASSSVVVTLNVTAGISISAPANVTMSTALGVAQSSAVGTTTWTVITNDSNGYTLAVNATSSPAMQSGANTITDYQTGTPNTWNATSTSAYFGYSAFGTDVATSTWGTGAVCGTGPNTVSATLNYKGFTTSPFTVASRSSTTTPSGVATTVCYAAQQGASYFVPSGTYTATIVATATSL